MMAIERFNPRVPHISLGWVVCSVHQAEKASYTPPIGKSPCGFWEIEVEGVKYKRPDRYSEMSPYDWTKIEEEST
jgi:hypothetical protein